MWIRITWIIALAFIVFSSDVKGTTIYDARLSGSYQGTVQVLTYQGWVGICSYTWGSSDSRVLCRQLGYSYSRSTSTSSVATLYYFSISCTGSETKLSQCSYSYNGESTSCSSVTVYCTPCINGRVQLRDGVIPEAGTVEYCINGVWKAVCHNSWDYKDAFVVCRQLGYPATGAIAYQNSYFGDRPIHLSTYYNCFGNESSLSNCRTSSTSSCDSVRDAAGVNCKGDVITEFCINGHIRLAGGRDMYEGRVEICSNGLWGTIWGGNWDSRDAKVVCRQLGFYQTYSRVEVFYNSYFGAGTGPILYAYLSCDGTETTINDCSATSSFPFSVGHYGDAGVRCNRPATTTHSNCANGDVRLVNGTTSYEGRVEICYNGIWGSVCDSGWDYWDAAIVCLQLGFQGANATALTGSYFGNGTGPYHLTSVGCSGEESSLLQCISSSNIGIHRCSSNRDAGVRCDASTCSHGDVRLFGGYTDRVGVAEVCINGLWGDICDDVTDQTTLARIFCKQFTREASPSYIVSSCCTRQRNTGNITLYGVSCSDRSRPFIQDCSYQLVSGYSSNGCDIREELIIGCYEQSSCTSGDIRLRNGSSSMEGRVEICSQGVWGSVTTSSWDSTDAQVVCKQLGYHWEWAIGVRNGLYGRGGTRHVARNVRCSRDDESFSDCSYTSISSTSSTGYESSNAAGVICQGNTSAPIECEHGQVRLVNGSHRAEGRVEVCAHGYWATTCYSIWDLDLVETEIVCKQLNLPTDGSQFLSGSPFGFNYQLPIVQVACGSAADNISECQIYNQNFNSYCNHRSNIGIRCQERTYYLITMDVFPAKESYEIGSTVTINCTVYPTPVFHGDTPLLIWYRWSSTYGAISSTSTTANTLTITVPNYHLHSVNYYCRPFSNGRLLGTQKITLNVKGLLHKNTNTANSQMLQEHSSISLHVETTNSNILNSLLNLTWYHNGSVIVPSVMRYALSQRNKTLTITNFTFGDAGMYEVQFNQLFVHPYNKDCKEEVLPLLRYFPALSPLVFCVNTAKENCSKTEDLVLSRQISIKAMYSDFQGTLNTITIKATGTVSNSKELRHSRILWYRNGRSIALSTTTSLSPLKKHENKLILNQEIKISNATFEDSGSFEVLLAINLYTYTRENTLCQPYYNRFISSYLRRDVILAQEHTDIEYYKDLTFSVSADKEATSSDDGATVTCEASIQFPPFSMLSFIKNGETVATSTDGLLQVETRSAKANPFGLYTCQLNASGEMFQKSFVIKERAALRMTVNTENQGLCTNPLIKTAVEDAVTLKIASECQCTFDKTDFHNSSITCRENGVLTYTATMVYSNDDGSETASLIVERLVRQAPFSMSVNGMSVTATSVCSNCDTATSLSPAAGGGLFVGGFVVAAVIAVIIIIVVIAIVIVKKRHATSNGKSGHQQEPESSGDPIRYASSGRKKTGSAKPQTTKIDLSYQKEDYEEMHPADQPIYEETF